MAESSLQTKIKFDYIKSNFFRTARADGAWAGMNGYADIVLNFFSERTPIPQRTVQPTIGQRLGEEIVAERVIRDAIVREVEISLSMSIDVAKAMRTLLDGQIRAVELGKKK